MEPIAPALKNIQQNATKWKVKIPDILFGFILHFSPIILKEKITHWFTKQSFVVQAILVSLVITSVLILNTQRTVPFIYFQF